MTYSDGSKQYGLVTLSQMQKQQQEAEEDRRKQMVRIDGEKTLFHTFDAACVALIRCAQRAIASLCKSFIVSLIHLHYATT